MAGMGGQYSAGDIHVECRGFESHPRQLIFLMKSDCLDCAVLLCLVVCLTLLAFFPSFFISKICMYTYTYMYIHVPYATVAKNWFSTQVGYISFV